MSTTKREILWLPQPEEHNYPAAASFLRLILSPHLVDQLVSELKQQEICHYKAKDIFRASELSLLGISNSHVAKDQKKIDRGKPLSPILLVRDTGLRRVIIADGYHRLCAVYSVDEDAAIPCQIVSLSPS